MLTDTKDPKVCGGIMVKFGTIALDSSMRNLIREKAVALQQKVQEKVY